MKKAKGKKINGKATRDLVFTALFTALVAIGAFIRIPAPIVPITLQFAFCLLAGLLLGAVRGGLAVTIYIVMGLIGIPVFTEGGGIFYVLKPSFGYLIGMAIGTFTCGFIARSGKKLSYTRMVAGALVSRYGDDFRKSVVRGRRRIPSHRRNVVLPYEPCSL